MTIFEVVCLNSNQDFNGLIKGATILFKIKLSNPLCITKNYTVAN